MTESADPATSFKNAYFDFIDQAFNLTKQSTESAKKMIGATMDAQSDIYNTLVQSKLLPNTDDIVRQNFLILETATKQANQGLNVSKTFLGTFSDAALVYQKMALDTQKIAIQGYSNWLQMFKA